MASDEVVGADPARTMSLLWGDATQGTRGPKRTLTVERIVAAAVELADSEGLAALSMRRVADRLGVGAMSLYRYVPAKAELVELMLDSVLAEVVQPANAGQGWRAQLESFGRQTWAQARRHPWTLQVPAGRGLLGPNQSAMLDTTFRALLGAELPPAQAVAIFTAVASYVRGSAWATVEAVEAERQSGVTDEQWWTALAPVLSHYVTEVRFPALAAAWATPEVESPQETFEFGLERLLDGIELLLRRPAG